MAMRPDHHRRKWNREEYERLAEDRKREASDNAERTSKAPPVNRTVLKQRDYKINLESTVGTSVLINKTTPSAQSGGYYCKMCDCLVKDSTNYLDHINGIRHHKNLGMSMSIERSSLDAVKQRFIMNKMKLETKKKQRDMETRMREIAEEEEKFKEYSRNDRKQKKRKIEEVEEGFSGFSSTKK